jgi:hypothetical protein
MQGAQKRQVNAEEMLAELKRALESSTPAPNAPPPSASTAPKSSSPRGETWRSQIDKRSDRPVKANADSSIGQPTDVQKSTRPSSRRWKLTAGGLALAGVAAVCASFARMNKAPDLPTHELPAAATEGLVRPQNEQALKPSSDSRPLMEEGQQAAPLQAGALETRPDASTAPANNGSVPAQGKAEVEPNLASSGLESAAPAFTPAPLNSAAVWAPSQRIGPDGAPIATAPSTRASTDSAPRLAETPKSAVPSAPPQVIKPDGRPVATAAPIPASTDSAPPAETPKPNATKTASVSNASARPSTPKVDSKKKPTGKTSLQKPRESAKAAAKPVAQAERQSTEPARPKEAERSPQPAQDAGNPTTAAPVTATTVQQRFADGMTHAFSYLVHLPGALVPHPADPNADGH